MKKRIEGLTVETDLEDGSIMIRQGGGYHGDQGQAIIFTPHQLPLLIEMLQEASAEILKGQ